MRIKSYFWRTLKISLYVIHYYVENRENLKFFKSGTQFGFPRMSQINKIRRASLLLCKSSSTFCVGTITGELSKTIDITFYLIIRRSLFLIFFLFHILDRRNAPLYHDWRYREKEGWISSTKRNLFIWNRPIQYL